MLKSIRPIPQAKFLQEKPKHAPKAWTSWPDVPIVRKPLFVEPGIK